MLCAVFGKTAEGEMNERETDFDLQMDLTTLVKVCSVYVCIMKAAVYISRVNKGTLCLM